MNMIQSSSQFSHIVSQPTWILCIYQWLVEDNTTNHKDIGTLYFIFGAIAVIAAHFSGKLRICPSILRQLAAANFLFVGDVKYPAPTLDPASSGKQNPNNPRWKRRSHTSICADQILVFLSRDSSDTERVCHFWICSGEETWFSPHSDSTHLRFCKHVQFRSLNSCQGSKETPSLIYCFLTIWFLNCCFLEYNAKGFTCLSSF